LAAPGKGTVASVSTRVDGRRRAVVESVRPCISCGRFPVKRTLGDALEVTADVFGDGHDELGAVVRYRHESDRRWTEASMAPLGNDRWRASVQLPKLGRYRYAVRAWVDPFRSWSGGSPPVRTCRSSCWWGPGSWPPQRRRRGAPRPHS
jgi:alpha-1,4-glucan:maltose-1-phosphate maltosyltransferase-like protein